MPRITPTWNAALLPPEERAAARAFARGAHDTAKNETSDAKIARMARDAVAGKSLALTPEEESRIAKYKAMAAKEDACSGWAKKQGWHPPLKRTRASELDSIDAIAAFKEYGDNSKAAAALGIPRTTFRDLYRSQLLERGGMDTQSAVVVGVVGAGLVGGLIALFVRNRPRNEAT